MSRETAHLLFVKTYLVSAVSKEAKEVKKEVDEIKIQGQSTENSEFGRIFGTHVNTGANAFEFLHVIGGQTCEDEHSDETDDVFHAAAMQEHVHQGSDDNTNQCHDKDASEFGEVGFGRISHNSHHAKGERSDAEGLKD